MAATVTPEQMEALLSYMRGHQDLARGRLINSLEGRLRARRLWDDLANILNGLGGSIKTTKQWQKVWADRKYLAKKAQAAATRSIVATGGGPASAPPLRGVDLAVADIMGENYGLPISNAFVDAFAEQDENRSPNLPPQPATPSTSLGSQGSISILDTELPICLMDVEVAYPEVNELDMYSHALSTSQRPMHEESAAQAVEAQPAAQVLEPEPQPAAQNMEPPAIPHCS